ncbi:hypothetical protein [Streptomyces agglomeratus]|uniref:hypothetical protein n=1 Tax=Streptomyces agglomeratus TaxID=285458 RepID=UPI00159F2A50|nr:hypothetical protein [Streptomyces agglomeratus]
MANFSMDSPALCATTVRALVSARTRSFWTSSPNVRHNWAESLSRSSFAVGQL